MEENSSFSKQLYKQNYIQIKTQSREVSGFEWKQQGKSNVWSGIWQIWERKYSGLRIKQNSNIFREISYTQTKM